MFSKKSYMILCFMLCLFTGNAYSNECQETDLYKQVEEKQTKYITFSLSDVVTTELVLQNGGTEMNPFGVYGTLAAKIVLYYYANSVKNECTIQSLNDSKEIYHSLSSLLAGASTNNLLVFLGVSNPVSLLSGIGYFFYRYNQK